MSLRHESADWQVGRHEAYMPVYYQGAIAGFFKREFSESITKHLNEDELLKKALTTACTDLIRQSGGDIHQVKTLINEYLKMCDRPKYGTLAVAALLQERQQELDLGDREFTKFCDTFKLSPVELNNIYAGEHIDDSLIAPISRILGLPKDELLQVRDGYE
ncbi:hypothetical protein NIES4101_39620 [Calothrix sp. NIES-4101]|nr:hypothetical protein NIES4101_39620 [Calothrix sp. NIES-4101]